MYYFVHGYDRVQTVFVAPNIEAIYVLMRGALFYSRPVLKCCFLEGPYAVPKPEFGVHGWTKFVDAVENSEIPYEADESGLKLRPFSLEGERMVPWIEKHPEHENYDWAECLYAKLEDNLLTWEDQDALEFWPGS